MAAVEVRAQPIAALLLREFGLTAEALARSVGLDGRAVRSVLEGSCLPTSEEASRIAQYLGAREDSLFLPERREGKYHARSCRACRTEFQPTGPNNVFCGTCRPRQTR